MSETSGDFDLAQEALGSYRGRKLGSEHLDRDGTVVLQIAREIDDRHPATAQLAHDEIASGEMAA